LDGECNSLTVVTPQVPTIQAPVGGRSIKGPLSGTYSVGTAQVAPNYTRLTDAINDINTYGVNNPAIFELAADYSDAGETLPLSINAFTGASAINTLKIKPAPGTNPIISGTGLRY
jgi:hypothetical protein